MIFFWSYVLARNECLNFDGENIANNRYMYPRMSVYSCMPQFSTFLQKKTLRFIRELLLISTGTH